MEGRGVPRITDGIWSLDLNTSVSPKSVCKVSRFLAGQVQVQTVCMHACRSKLEEVERSWKDNVRRKSEGRCRGVPSQSSMRHFWVSPD